MVTVVKLDLQNYPPFLGKDKTMPRHKFTATFQFIALMGLIVWTTQATAKVKLPPVLSSHMVLQREMPVPIWGTAAPGEKITVSFRDQEKSTTADPQGKWLVKLDPLKAGGPDPLKIAGTDTTTLEDVLVGEVWVGSGQSNMDMGVNSYTKGDEVLEKMAAETYPRLRLIRAGNPGWLEATPKNIGGTSAMLFSFGLPLHKELDVPVGLMVGAVGGTPSGYWLSEEAFQNDVACKEVIAKFAKTYSLEQAQKSYEQALAKWEKDVAAAKQKGEKRLPGKPRSPLPAGRVRPAHRQSVREPHPPVHALRHPRRALGSRGERHGDLRRRSVHADGRPDPRLAQGVGTGRLPLHLHPEAQRRRVRLGPGRSGHLQGGKVCSTAGQSSSD